MRQVLLSSTLTLFFGLLALGCSGDGSADGNGADDERDGAGWTATTGDGGEGSRGDGDGGSPGGTTGAGAGEGTGGAAASSDFELPPTSGLFDYQIGGAYEPPAGTTIVSRDREASPAMGIYNICYVNGFQTQPSDESWWLSNHSSLLLRDKGGDLVEDEDWGEMILDTTTAENRAALAEIVGEWIEGCAAAGFDAIEIDNLDTYSRSDGLISKANNAAFMGLLSQMAHDNGLASGQKNSTELLELADEMGTDFAVAEECQEWNECGDYTAVYGNLVYVIEYDSGAFDTACSNFPDLAIVLRDMDVSASGQNGYVYDGC